MDCKVPVVRNPEVKSVLVNGKEQLTKREQRLGKIVSKQVNYTRKEWKAKKRKEAEARDERGKR